MTITSVFPQFKIALISTTVLTAAIALKYSVPVVADFAVSEVPSIYNGVVSWLKPPYLYLIINCIIITIVASSKLQSKKDDDVSVPLENTILPQPQVKNVEIDYPVDEYKYDGVVLAEEKALDFDDSYAKLQTENVTAPFVAVGDGFAFAKDATSNKENEFVVAKSVWNLVEKKDSTEYSPKPPVSARFGHRRNVRSSPEGGKTVLGVSKPKKQDTLESTWKTITEGRAVPLNRHLRKSDTWERDSHRHDHSREKTPQKAMTKAETFNDRTNTRSPSPGSTSSGGSGKLRREPSLTQDELHRRVEAFIKKFNEDMRLQRQESLNQYKEMINRGAH